jgi:hypothetical protein
MPMTFDGSGTITGLAAGGLPNGTVQPADLSTGAPSWTTSGNLILQGGNSSANGIGVTFPATQSASTDANTLDDYEEGTWTPAADRNTTSPTLSYSYRSGNYTKIGRMVYCQFDLTISSISAAGSGQNTISGLPFNALSGNSDGGFSVAQWRSSGGVPVGPSATSILKGFVDGTKIFMEFDNIGNAGSATNATTNGNYSAARISGFVVYQVS